EEDETRAALIGPDQRDAERARHRIDQERELPAPVAAGEVEVTLDEGIRGLHLVTEGHHRGSPDGGRGPIAHRDRARPYVGSPARRVPKRTIDVPMARRIDGAGRSNRRLIAACRICSARMSLISRSWIVG